MSFSEVPEQAHSSYTLCANFLNLRLNQGAAPSMQAAITVLSPQGHEQGQYCALWLSRADMPPLISRCFVVERKGQLHRHVGQSAG